MSKLTKHWKQLFGVLSIGVLTSLCVNSVLSNTITVKLDEPGKKVSPKFYGIFFEEINMAGDGGLYAELIRNRNFEDSKNLDHWQVRAYGKASANVKISPDVPTGGFNKQSALVNVMLPDGMKGAAGISNSGYFGIAVDVGQTYILNLYAKGDVKNIQVWVEDEDGTLLTEKENLDIHSNWEHYSLKLKSKDKSTHARLLITTAESGTFNLDMVSLFPQKTWKNRENGMRIDLAEKLEALKPAFVRFPGGCWVEGDRMDTSYRWKQTIGKLSERRTQHNLWGYEVSHGMGYHEYLQLCEDLNAEALFVINCGMSHKEVVPMDKMGEYVQDALDAIEYAVGSTDTRWGAERAKNGHPKPFNLTMVQIGNENGGTAYDERYALFYDAIKKKYPKIKIVACLWGGTPKSRPIDILDEHYYNTPEFFQRRFNMYDDYKREEMEIYVGEYAVTQQNGQGALRGALGEAIYMMGMENNSDVVKMTSYAPLFVNVNKRVWNPDLINFNNHCSFGTPSYHLQKLFAQNIGTQTVPVETKVESVKKNLSSPGGIGLGTWLTQAEFKDIKVESDGEVIYESRDGFDEWKECKGEWTQEGGIITQLSQEENIFAYLPANYQEYTLTLKARKRSGNEGFLILANVVDERNYIWCNIGGWGNVRHGLEMVTDGAKTGFGTGTNGKIETSKWYDIRVVVTKEKIVCFLNGDKICEGDLVAETNQVYASATADKEYIYLKVVNISSEPKKLKVKLNSDEKFSSKATLFTISHPDEWAENSFYEPERIAPVETKVKISSETEYEFQGNSINVLKILRK